MPAETTGGAGYRANSFLKYSGFWSNKERLVPRPRFWSYGRNSSKVN